MTKVNVLVEFIRRQKYCLMFLLLLFFSTITVEAVAGPFPMNFRPGKTWSDSETFKVTSLSSDEVNITSVEGHTASLPCKVNHLDDKTVSWIRTKDLTVIAVDRMTVTTDRRFSVKHPEETSDWILQIQDALLFDSGTYDCQVNTYPKKSTRINLSILTQKDYRAFLEMPSSDSGSYKNRKDPKFSVDQSEDYKRIRETRLNPQSRASLIHLNIAGPSDVEVSAGKAVGLTCQALGINLNEVYSSSRSPGDNLIEWTLDEVPVTLLFGRQKVEIFEDWENNQSAASYLTVFDVAVEDSGIYSCHAPHAIKKSIPVTVTTAISSTEDHTTNSRVQSIGSHQSYPERKVWTSGVPENRQQMDAAAAAQSPSFSGVYPKTQELLNNALTDPHLSSSGESFIGGSAPWPSILAATIVSNFILGLFCGR